jgi:pimeloyl-ACP methyl ester carboxylesterase
MTAVRRFGTAPVDVLALSLSCEYAARAAVESPQPFRSIALVSPTGFSKAQRPAAAAQDGTRFRPWLYAALRGPGWGASIFRDIVL